MIDLLIIGAGPAGMAAAVTAANAGLSVTVVDEQARAGGQIFRRPPSTFSGEEGHYAPYSWSKDLIAAFETHPGITRCFRSTAYGVLQQEEAQELSVGIAGPAGGSRVACRRLLVATGAFDMPVAFPGWTKPGVMAVGAVQSLLKSQKVLAGRRIVLSGSHPLLLIAAKQLLDAGAEISEIAFARGLPSPTELARALPAAPGHLGVFTEAARAVATILKHRVRVSTRTVVTAAHGTSAVTGVSLSRVDTHWRPIGEPRTLSADLLAIGFGFQPSTELARQAGCEMRWDSPKGGWIVKHDEHYATSVPGVFVAGEPTGVAGAEQSWATGMMAGIGVAASLGVDPELLSEPRRVAERALRGADRFATVVQEMFEPHRAALADLSNPADTLVCRCELVTSGEVDRVLSDNPFISSANALKLECRTGMGPCQGRYCEGTVTTKVAQARAASIERSGHFTAHLPVKPVPLSTYLGLDGDGQQQNA